MDEFKHKFIEFKKEMKKIVLIFKNFVIKKRILNTKKFQKD
jgi:hypothetical protein